VISALVKSAKVFEVSLSWAPKYNSDLFTPVRLASGNRLIEESKSAPPRFRAPFWNALADNQYLEQRRPISWDIGQKKGIWVFEFQLDCITIMIYYAAKQ
jgi:hypothetical protein